ncbi:hypothetical protein FKM82_016189 [Ascaphus truei]
MGTTDLTFRSCCSYPPTRAAVVSILRQGISGRGPKREEIQGVGKPATLHMRSPTFGRCEGSLQLAGVYLPCWWMRAKTVSLSVCGH